MKTTHTSEIRRLKASIRRLKAKARALDAAPKPDLRRVIIEAAAAGWRDPATSKLPSA